MELSNTFVVLMGLGIVFFGLACIILLCHITSFICRKCFTTAPEEPKALIPSQDDEIPNRQEFIAAVSAVIAEELGTDVTGIRICSVKKL